MKIADLKKLIKEEIYKISEAEPVVAPTADAKVAGQINTELFKKLGVVDFDPSKFSTTVNLVKQNKPLNTVANKVLADIMIAMIKTGDDTLLSKIFNNLKQIEAK